MKNAGKACNNRLYRHIRTFEKIVKNYFVIYVHIRAISGKKARLINELVLPISDDRKDNVRKQYVKCLGEDISERDN